MGQKKVEPILCVESLTKRRPSMNKAKHGKILKEHLKNRRLFTMNNLSTTFQIPKDLLYKERTWATRTRLVLQGKDLSYKDKTWATRKRLGLQGKEVRPHSIKAPTSSSH